MGKVVLVGAGPGDPELITLKGIKYLQMADVIVYDKLVSRELINYAKPSCSVILLSSDDIEIDLLKKYALENKLVIRLKNGDPYVFGRGGKICQELIKDGIECEVIPGVSSVNSVPAYAGIPLTFNGISDMITVISAVTQGGRLFDFGKIPSYGTLVVLMGGKRLEEVSKGLMTKRDPSEEVAVIQRGTYFDQKVNVTKLRELTKIGNLASPSILVLGDVVKLRGILWKSS
ncbi:Uroporphyrinogen-III methyltransferase [Saccharolobus shibatae]|uniref:uroporphyrinogen-III C-methyltransferase n=1 Tax=Saccharolobus shibatae TaxID=2286 RepID=A0A8F5BZ42_9CREN|nr:Uroporphyrinogen-III methyltransferase [Saccharolobus shibatae]